MKKLKTEKAFKQKKTGRKTIIFIIICLAVLSAGRIFAANRLVDFTEKLSALDRTAHMLSASNEELTVSLSQASSLAVIREKALANGFLEESKVVFATSDKTVAARLP